MNRHLLPVWLHIAILIVAPIALTIGLFISLNWFLKKYESEDSILGTVAFIVACASGFAAHAALRYHLPAKCSHCGGPAKYHDGSPITYQCIKCGTIESGWFSSTESAP